MSMLADRPEPRVFLSHASENEEVAQTLCRELEGRGIKCWISSRDIPLGAEYGDGIMEAIHSSSFMIVLLSEAALRSGFVKREVERATSLGKTLLPVFLEKVHLTGTLEFMLALPHWTHLESCHTDPVVLDQLADRIKGIDTSRGDPVRPSAPSSAKPSSLLWAAVVAVVVCGGLLLRQYMHRTSATGSRTEQPAIVAAGIGGEGLQSILVQALKLHRNGKTDEATRLLGSLKPTGGESRLLAAVTAYLDRGREAQRQEQLRALIDTIAARKGKDNEVVQSSGARPRVLACLGPVEAAGAEASDAALLFRIALRSALEETGRFRVVERDALEDVLKEMDLGSSDLADARAASVVGRLLPASLLLMGNAVASGDSLVCYLRLVDTETGEVLQSYKQPVRRQEPFDPIVVSLADRIATDIVGRRPLRAAVESNAPEGLQVALGRFHGVAGGTVFEIFPREAGASPSSPELPKGSGLGYAAVEKVGEMSSAMLPRWNGAAPAADRSLMVVETPSNRPTAARL